MTTNLILRDDRNILKTVAVSDGDLKTAFHSLLDHMESVYTEFDCGCFDEHKDLHSIIKRDIDFARKHFESKDDILSFFTPTIGHSLFSVTYQERP